VVVTVGLFAAGMFEFNFGDTDVYLMMLDVLALVVAFLERPQPANEPSPLLVGPVSPLPSVARP
jgi:hypothetical protein